MIPMLRPIPIYFSNNRYWNGDDGEGAPKEEETITFRDCRATGKSFLNGIANYQAGASSFKSELSQCKDIIVPKRTLGSMFTGAQ